MITALFIFFDDHVDVGFSGDSAPQASVTFQQPLGSFKLQTVLLECINILLTSPRSIIAVIVEPPLMSLTLKQNIAEFLLGHCKVPSIGFIQQSVCCMAGLDPELFTEKNSESGCGLLIDKSQELAVPVYDHRELTTYAMTTAEYPFDKMLALLLKELPLDIRKQIGNNIISTEETSYALSVWQGASALTKCRKVWPILTREKFKQGFKVWDSLYDMR